jgi:hypothetical protein
MAFYKIKSGRVTGERGVLQYIGEIGHLFYSQDDNVIRISDGHTLGGIPLSGGSITFISIGAPPNPLEGQLWWNTVDGRLYIWYDNNWVDASPESNVAADDDSGYTTTATVKSLIANSLTNYVTQSFITGLGYTTTATVTALIANSLTNYATTSYVTNSSHPSWSINSGTTSVTVASDGSVTLSANSMVTAFESDFNIQVANTSNSINIFGEFHVHSPAVLGITPESIFRVLQDGQVRVLVPKQDFYEGGVTIVGSTSSNFISPQNLGVMLHVIGQLNQPNRYYMDGNNTYNAIVGRRHGGTIANPTPVVKDDVLLRIGGLGYAPSGFPTFQSSRIAFVAAETHTDANQGGRIEFYTNATGTNFLARDISVDSHGITFRDNTVQDTAAIPYTQRGTALGVATLDGGGKVPLTQLPAGAVVYKGAWDASTNLTAIGGYALSDTTPAGLQSGWQYSVSVTGTRNIGSGSETFTAGDYVTYNGTHWDRIPGAGGSVISFNGRTGDVVMTTTDVTSVLTPTSIPTNRLVTNSFTFNQGAGITVSNNGVASALGSSVTISNVGVTSVTTGTGIRVSANTGTVLISYANDAGYITSSALTGYATQSWVSSQGYLTSLVTATNSVLGGVKIDNSTITINGSGQIVANYTNYTLPTASTSTLGGVKVDGATVSINGSGVISAIAAVNYYPITKDVNLVGDTTFNFSFATDVYIRMKYDTALTIGFQDMSPGKVVSIVAVNTSNNSRTVTLGLAQGHATNSNASTVNISPSRVAMIRYVCFGTSSSDVYCEVSYQ